MAIKTPTAGHVRVNYCTVFEQHCTLTEYTLRSKHIFSYNVEKAKDSSYSSGKRRKNCTKAKKKKIFVQLSHYLKS